jgi:hypothetical protein
MSKPRPTRVEPWTTCLSQDDGALLLPACGEKVGMRGLMRFRALCGSG